MNDLKKGSVATFMRDKAIVEGEAQGSRTLNPYVPGGGTMRTSCAKCDCEVKVLCTTCHLKLEEENEHLRTCLREAMEVLDLIDGDGERAKTITAPEDEAVLHLCLRHGYGAVVDSAARQWFRKDHIGALTVGPCAISVRAVRGLLSSVSSVLSKEE